MSTVTTYTPSLRLEQQPDGANSNTWGDHLDLQMSLIDQAIAGIATINVAGNQNVTLSASNGQLDQARNMALTLTGTLTGSISLILPAVPKLYLINNSTFGNFDVTLSTGTANAVTAVVPNTTEFVPVVGPGFTISSWGSFILCDGINVFFPTNFFSAIGVGTAFIQTLSVGSATLDGGTF